MNSLESIATQFDRQVLDEMLDYLVIQNGSDLHLTPNNPPVFRIDGNLVVSKKFNFILSADPLSSVLQGMLNQRAQEIFRDKKQVDFRYETNTGRFRANIFREMKGVAGVFRAIPVEIPTPEALFLPDEILSFTEEKSGLVLIVGATGSGKSTTLACLLGTINKRNSRRIITIEDPIEFVHKPIKSLISHREIGEHVNSFAEGLKAALREDPDVILVGEMRDLETMSLAIEAALTGHLVFATVHARSVTQTVARIVKVFPPQEQDRIQTTLADALKGIVFQVLVPKVGGGRVALFEILKSSAAASEHIREGNFHQITSIQSKMGYFPLQMSAKNRYVQGLIDKDTYDLFKK